MIIVIIKIGQRNVVIMIIVSSVGSSVVSSVVIMRSGSTFSN